jgi:hypothetical protein
LSLMVPLSLAFELQTTRSAQEQAA